MFDDLGDFEYITPVEHDREAFDLWTKHEFYVNMNEVIYKRYRVLWLHLEYKGLYLIYRVLDTDDDPIP